jgi:hypothetical protein
LETTNFQKLWVCFLKREEDFWLKTSIGTSFSFILDEDKPESDKKRLIHILNHPQVIPYVKLRKNIIIAVCLDE